jgi:hypothetical protein
MVLRERIQRFAYQERFAEDVDRALGLYFGEEVRTRKLLAADEEEIPGFQEWFISDYVTGEGERIVDLFAQEKGPALPRAQRQMLDDWRRLNRYRLFEVQEVMPGKGVVVEDLLSGEVMEINDISSSHSLQRWMLFLARPARTEGRMHFTGSGQVLAQFYKDEVVTHARTLWERYRQQHPSRSLDDFYRDHSLDLYLFVQGVQTRPITERLFTPEGHRLVSSHAHFAVKDARTVADILTEAEEFNLAGPNADDPTALHFNWLLRGRSHVPESDEEMPPSSLIQGSDWMAGPGEPVYRSLGDVILWERRMELACLSRERLEVGKAFLDALLGKRIRHRRDRFRSADQLLAGAEFEPPRSPRSSSSGVEASLAQEMLERRLGEALDTPVPALGGLTPRQAARQAEHQVAFKEWWKRFEYMEEQRRRQGELHLDLDVIRRELGLPASWPLA